MVVPLVKSVAILRLMLTLSLGMIGSVLVVGALFSLGSEWVEIPLLSQKGTLREPTSEERERITRHLDRESTIREMPILVFDGHDDVQASTLAAPFGLPGRQSFIFGSNFLEQEDEFIASIISLQDSRLADGIYKKKFVAGLIRLELFLLLLIALVPFLSPTPGPIFAMALIGGVVAVLFGLDYWIRSLVYTTDHRAATDKGRTQIVDGLLTYANRTGVPKSRSRLMEHFEFTPSIDDRIAKLRSLQDDR